MHIMHGTLRPRFTIQDFITREAGASRVCMQKQCIETAQNLLRWIRLERTRAGGSNDCKKLSLLHLSHGTVEGNRARPGWRPWRWATTSRRKAEVARPLKCRGGHSAHQEI